MNCNKIQMGDLDAYVHGELSAVEANSLETHLFGCQDCAAELRHLREEKRLFRLRSESDAQEVPAFADVLARISREESTVVANDPEAGRVVVLAKVPRAPVAPRKTESSPTREKKYVVSRWAQAAVVCVSTAAAAWTLLGVTPPKTEDMAILHPHGEEMEIGADPICTTENSSASAEVLASLPQPCEESTNVPNSNNDDSATCGEHHVEAYGSPEGLSEPSCDEENLPICGESGP